MSESPPSTLGSDRRQYDRVPAKIEVRFPRVLDAARALAAYSLNFSPGGICIRSAKPYRLDEQVALTLEVEGEHFEMNASVAWVRSGAVGLRFEGVNQADRERLVAVVAALKKKT